MRSEHRRVLTWTPPISDGYFAPLGFHPLATHPAGHVDAESVEMLKEIRGFVEVSINRPREASMIFEGGDGLLGHGVAGMVLTVSGPMR